MIWATNIQLNDLFSGLQAVVFDFDGVILESGHIKTESFVALLAEQPALQPAFLAYHLQHLGISRYVKFRYMVEELLARPYTPADETELEAAFERLVLDKILVCPFVAGAKETLRALRNKLPTFVASGTPHEELKMIVEKRGLAPYFNEVWGTPQSKPTILQHILQRHGWQANEVLMIGDGLSDYEAATAVGCRFLARFTEEQAAAWQPLDVLAVADLTFVANYLNQP